MALQYFTLVHVLISLIGIAAGFGMLSGLLSGNVLPIWTACFLATTVATSVTGFFFPIRGFTPAIGVGMISMVVLALASYSIYVQRLAGLWRRVFVISSVMALYLNVFVLIVQLFQKMPALAAVAPSQTEPAFVLTQALLLVGFVAFGMAVIARFRGGRHDS